MDWKQLLVYITGSVEEDLLLRIEYLAAENRILRDQIKGRVQLVIPSAEPSTELGCWNGYPNSASISGFLKPWSMNYKRAREKAMMSPFRGHTIGFRGSSRKRSPPNGLPSI